MSKPKLPAPNFRLDKLLASAADRMKADLRERLIAHPGELGTDREEVVRSFLRSYLPKRFEVSTGFVFDASGAVSKQIDVIIADSLACTHFETSGGTRYYPCESVVAIGQVKSSLTSEKKILDSLDNLESVKLLDRSARGRAFDKRFNEKIDHRFNHLHQIFSFVLVTGKAISGAVIQEHVLEYVISREAHLWPNVFLALDQYLVTFCCDDGVCPNPMHARGIALQKAEDSPDLIMRFFLLLGQAIEEIRVAGLPYWEYLNEIHNWTAEVMYSCTDDPPPYLSAL
ncbi:DUF6602 domain-containing protein [Massilia sp. W12]|uniref:DUF6602 domain-containing protein n=1 Tax=Massilia sp. W12 TaxID=3126507 RepID=UPI0030D37E56